MLNLEDLKKYDRREMYKIYDQWPKIALESYSDSFESINYEKINHIVFEEWEDLEL